MDSVYDLLFSTLAATAEADSMAWLEEERTRLTRDFAEIPFFFAFSGVSRRFDRSATAAFAPEIAAALTARVPGLCLEDWDAFRLARTILLGVLETRSPADRLHTLHRLASTADIREQIALFGALPFLPDPRELVDMARDGLRTNIVSVFDAIALRNPFPARHFPEEAWNQMVLKALFLGRPLYQVHGFEARINAALAQALDYLAHERWSAGRKVSPELWRGCAGFIDGQIAADLGRVAASDEPGQREAAALLTMRDSTGLLESLRPQLAPECAAVASGSLTWDSLGQRLATPA